MKKFMSAILSVVLCIPIMAVGFSAEEEIIEIPYSIKAPRIDGVGDDSVWKNAYTETLNPTEALKKGNYVQEPNNLEGAASANISILWNEQGLYFKWVVVDPTQSFALDLPSPGLNAMDGVQIVLDPFNKRLATVKNCAFCFTFVPYTCPRGSGVGQVPTGECSWYEHWQWVGMYDSLGLQMATSLVSKPDDNDDGVDQVLLISGYTIEAFIPVAALALNNIVPEFKENTEIGIGLMLMDYVYDHQKFIEAGGAEGAGAEFSQVYYNFCLDFSNNRKDIGKPQSFNTARLIIDEAGAFDLLTQAINKAQPFSKKTYLYTDKSLSDLNAVIIEAKKLTTDSTKLECMSKTQALEDALNTLVLKPIEERKGDVDSSGNVKLNDAMKVFQFVAGRSLIFDLITEPIFRTVADVSDNGKVELADAMKIFQLVAGKIDNFD
ncbi:MAG: hypothetical protein DBX47_06525 [Clostridiales bacterium]|nr:MAG: hypothetical protein DBX47_06525 [Clostridiales bacterium]